MITQIHHKKNELFEVEFYKDKECTKFIKRLPYAENAKQSEISNFYIELVNGDITPLTSLLLLSYNVNDYFYIPYIPNYKLFNLFAHNYKVKTLDDITPNLSKYIPEDNAVLFLSDAVADAKMYKIFASIFERCDGYMVYNNGELQSRCYRKQNFNFSKYTIFLPHGTQSELQKAEEVAKELMVKYGVKEVNLFALHCFVQRSNQFGSQALFIYKQGFYQKDCVSSEEKQYVFNKIITTNSTGILKPKDSSAHLQVVDCKEILEEHLNGNNLMQTL